MHAAQETAAQYREMAECANDMLLLIDENGTCQAVNRSYLLAGQLKPEKIIGQPVKELIGCPLIEMSTPALIRRCLGGEAIHLRKWYPFPSLGNRYMDIGYHRSVSSSGEYRNVVLVGRDVTDAFSHRGMSEFSNEQSALFSAAFDQIHLGIIVTLMPDGSVFLINTAAERMLGISKPELTGRSLYTSYGTENGWVCLYPDRRPCRVEALPSYRALVEGTITKNAELILKRTGADDIWVLVNSGPIRDRRQKGIGIVTVFSAMVTERDRQGHPVRIVGSAKDVTKHRQMEMDLRRSHDKMEAEVRNHTRELLAANRQLESIFNLSSESIWVSDRRGNVLKVSQASERLLNVKSENIVGRNVKDLVAEGMMDLSATLEVMATRRRVSMIQHLPQNGRQLLVTGTPIFDENGELSLVTVVERDLTELNKLQRQLKNTQSVSSKLKEELKELKMFEAQKQPVVAESPKMRGVLRTAGKLANQNISNILILGESGTGKGLLSSLIHENSPRKKGAFIGINCAALPDTLLEAELFGYEKGAFTGAREQGKAGLFELAQKGTLFLDEIGDLPLPLQAKLLKYLDDNTIMRLGGLKPIHIDCAIIAATNLDLESLVNQKKFRRDLYYRLNAFTILIPPLRERREDILELTRHFIQHYNEEFNTRKRLSLSTFNAIQSHRFPGNVRELKALIKKAVVLSEEDKLDAVVLQSIGRHPGGDLSDPPGSDFESASLSERLNHFERQMLKNALQKCHSTREMARCLQTSQTSIMRKLKKHGLSIAKVKI